MPEPGNDCRHRRRGGKAAICLVLAAVMSAQAASAATLPLPLPRPAVPVDPARDAVRMANGFAPFQREVRLALPDLQVPRAGALTLEATLAEGSSPLGKGVRWRVFGLAGGEGSIDALGEPELLVDTREARPQLDLAPGIYVVNCRFGAASVTERVAVGLTPSIETVVLNAGAMRITSLLGPNEPAPESYVTLDVFSGDPDLDPGSRIVKGVESGALIRLPAGSYTVISRYGEGNAVRRTKVRVDAGRLTDAQIVHTAAEISFKLVSAPGGEALAGTSWTVLTPGGDAVLESDGAYAGQVLAAGEYIAVAQLGEKVFNQAFVVQSGENTEIEVLASP